MPLRSSGGQPLADQIYSNLSRRIDDGAWRDRERLPSERALAEELGVCRVTIARAVNRLVAEGVLVRRRGSGTFVTPRQDGRRPATGTIALLIPFSRDAYASHIVQGVAAVLSDAGYHVLFHDTRADWRREAHQVQRLRGRVDGFLVFPADPLRNEDLFAELMAEGSPLVFVDRYCPTLATDWVVTDNYNASLDAVRRLLAQGRKRVVHITTHEMHCTSTLDRRLGYCQALLDAGLPVRQEDIRIATERLAGSNGDGVSDYAPEVADAPPLEVGPIIQALLDRREPVDALFAVNDWTMLACLHALHRAGVRVPDDVAVAGFVDNDMVSAHLPVPILAICQPKDEIGRLGAEILVRRLQGDTSPPQQCFLPATLREVGGWMRRADERPMAEPAGPAAET